MIKKELNHKTLLLDQSFQPITIINWQRAMQLYLGGRAEIVQLYKEISIHSVSQDYPLPAVLRLEYFNHSKYKRVNFSRGAVFARDNYTCAYCGEQFTYKHLSLDHIIPLSKGGLKNWHNIVTACFPCNLKKGSKTLSQAGLNLRHSPHEPKWTPLMILKLHKINQVIEEWMPYFSKK